MTASKSSSGRLLLRRALFIVMALGAIAAIVVIIKSQGVGPTVAASIQARLELAAGDVVVVHPSLGGADGVRASSGTPLLEGSVVRAGEGARALVRLPDGSTLFLRAGTTLKLLATSVELEQGEYWLDIPPVEREPLTHKLGDVSVSAADAAMSVARTADGAAVYVARGLAVVTAKGGRVEVAAGTRASVKGADAPAVTPVAFWDDWTGGMADVAGGLALGAGSGTIFGIDAGALPGTPASRMQLKSQTIRAVIKSGLAETTVDQTFFNPHPRAVEGWYWFSVPAGASVTGFAVETNGVLVEGEFVEQREAAQKYVGARESGLSPAILEWVDGRSYRARIYPVPASGARRVVLRYLELRPILEKKLTYVYPLGQSPVRIGELSLTVELGEEGKKMKLATVADARIEQGGTRVTMRRSGFTPRADFQLEATLLEARPTLSVARFAAQDGSADYVMARYVPDVDWAKVKPVPAAVVIVADTSAGGDESARQLQRAAVEALARSLSDKDRFAVIALDVRPRVLYPQAGLAPASDSEIAKALEALAGIAPSGATDLAAMFEPSLALLHDSEQPAVVYVGDGIATSGETTGEALAERLRRALSSSRARLFTVAVGADADHALLDALARSGGGRSFRIDQDARATPTALELAAAIKEPTITDFSLDLGAGLDEPFASASGKISRDSGVTVLARTHHELPSEVTVRGRLAGESFERKAKVVIDRSIVSSFVPRLWASEYVRHLLGAAGGPDTERGRIASLGLEYGIVTPFSSILALDSEASYSRMNIQRSRSRLRGIRLGLLTPLEEERSTREHPAGATGVAFGCDKREASQSSEEEPARANSEGGGEREGGSSRALGSGARRSEGDDVPASPAMEGAAGPSDGEDKHALDQISEKLAGPSGATGEQGRLGRSGADRKHSEEADASLDDAAGGLRFKGGGPSATATGAAPMAGVPPRTMKPTSATPAPDSAARDGKGVGKGVGEGLGRGAQGTNAGWGVRPPGVVVPTVCSDVAARPLEHRLPVWRKRIRTATNAAELIERYVAAVRACELNDWLAEREFLRILQLRVATEASARIVVGHFAPRPEVQKFLARLILRRTTDAHIIAALQSALFGNRVDWLAVDRELSEREKLDDRIEKLREAILRAPGDPNGEIRMVRLLARAGRVEEALGLGRRLRDSGILTIQMARQLGDVLSRNNHEDEAIRTYSEIVEFDPKQLDSRRLLGDIYLARGWYELAYRQFKTATEMAPNDPLSWLRLASAAAGAGRTDEALRLERKVASGEGRPGPEDPRRFARLASAARLARLLDKPPGGQPTSSIERELKELGLFAGPGTLILLTWEDLVSQLELDAVLAGDAAAVGEVTDAAAVGLSSVLLPPTATQARWSARLRTEPRDEDLRVHVHELRWDNKNFTVAVRAATLPAGTSRVEL